MNLLFLYSFLSLISLCLCADIMYNYTNEENNLYFVFTTFRHGARKPLFGVDFFGNRNFSAGALTKYGIIQHLEIGRKYRKRYSNFVNMSFDKNEFYIYSSNVRYSNFVNMSFDKNEFYIYSSNVRRTIVSTKRIGRVF